MHLNDIGKTMSPYLYTTLIPIILILLVFFVLYTVIKREIKEAKQHAIIASEIAEYQRAFLAINTKGNIQNELLEREANQIIKEIQEGTFWSRVTTNGAINIEKCQKHFDDVSDKMRLEIVEHAHQVNLIPRKGVDISSNPKAQPIIIFS